MLNQLLIAFGAPCMTITISEERIYLDRESLSDQSLSSHSLGGRSGATQEQPHIGWQRPIASLFAQSSKVLYSHHLFIAYRDRPILSPNCLAY